MSAPLQSHLTPEEYVAIERAAQFRSEYYNGRMYAMPGGSHAHAIAIHNMGRILGNLLEERPCLVTSSDLRVRVEPGGLYTYPDIVVVCGKPQYADDQRDTLLNPVLIIEVLSPSTEAYDRGFKSAQYRAMASLEEYALVSQAEPRIEVYRRQGAHWLLSEYIGLEAVCRLESVGCSLTLSAVYKNIAFGGEDSGAFRPSPSA
jgi:Uma2 family endonuclease